MKKIQGFTLIELLVTVTIIAILSGIAIVGLTSVRQKAQDTAHLSGIRDLQLSLEAYKSVNGVYPEAGTQGSLNDYISNLAPTFIGSLPNDGKNNSNSYSYSVSSDKKTYCVYVINTIFKPESQSDLYKASCPKSWVACKGMDVNSLTNCH
jgi:prepilin-type N-terminal cleavage/methylation domain-containing protein